MRKIALAALAAPFLASSALAAGEQEKNRELTELRAELREQIREMKETYEQRIAALEQKLVQAEQVASRAEGNARQAADAAATVAARTPAAAPPAAFNPEMSLILSGSYTNLSKNVPERRLQGFVPAGGEAMPEAKSFNLGESELALSANIDHLFRGNFRLAIAPDNTVGVEEASIQTLGLGEGVNIKAGRFLSGIGYQNEQHPHQWDFSDAPLPYQAFFGNPLGMDGVQARWLAPTPFLLEFGAETARARSFPATDSERNKNGAMSGSLFAHLGGDVGISNSWRAGLSYFQSRPRDRSFDDPLVVDAAGTPLANRFSGTSKTWIVDGVWKWAPNGNAADRYVKLSGEYFNRRESGDFTYDTNGTLLGTQRGGYRSRQSGFYAQAVWQFMPHWRVGYRYDQLDSGTMALGLIDSGVLTTADLPLLAAYKPKRNTLMADWSPSEFSRIRLQLAQDRTRPEATDNQVWLHYIMSLGAHGAHSF